MPSSDERRAIAQRAALTRSATEIGADISRPARQAFLDKFLPEPADGVSEEERQRQGRAALRLHMTDLARRSATVRRKVAEVADAAGQLADDCQAAAESLAHEAL